MTEKFSLPHAGKRNWHLRVIHFKSIWEGTGDLVFQNNTIIKDDVARLQ